LTLTVVDPNKPANTQDYGWVGTQEMVDVIEYVLKTYNVDLTRVYVSGLSQGGGAAFKLATTIRTSTSQPYGALFAAMAAAPAHTHVLPAFDAANPSEFFSYWHPGILRNNLCAGIAATGLPVRTFHNSDDTVSSSAVANSHLLWPEGLRDILTGVNTTIAGVDGTLSAAACPTVTAGAYVLTEDPGKDKTPLAGDPAPINDAYNPATNSPLRADGTDGHTDTWQWAYNPLRTEISGGNLYQWLLSQHR
jgi:hypothetical protein